MKRKIENIRNIGIIAHIDAGKTTVTERMLHYSGYTHRAGKVDDGTTTTDDDAEEQERGITIYSACVTFNWLDKVINLLDTPGHVDFTAEVERCLRVLDGAVVVFSAREGVEAQSETVWRQANRYEVPRLAFINKLDREGADYDSVFEQITERLGGTPVAVQIPVGEGPAHTNNPFRGVIDLIEMKMLVFDAETEGFKVDTAEIPAESRDMAELWRSMLLEKLYEFSNEMMELALEEKPIPQELIHKVLHEATVSRQIQPVLCGSALHGIGVQPLLDAVTRYLPNPLQRPPVEGLAASAKGKPLEKKEIRKPDPKEPFAGLVFKILPAKTGDIYWIRVYSGQLKSNSRMLNPEKGIKENVSQLWHIHATKKDRDGQVDMVDCGDIVGVIGPRDSITGDTLCDPKQPIILEHIQFPETVISMAIEPESTAEKDKLADTLEMLKRQDPTLSIKTGESGQTLISGMGELHLEVVKNRLLRDFKLNVKFHKPQVSYRESIAKQATVTGECDRQIGGKPLFARVKIKVKPVGDEQEKAVVIVNSLPADRLPGDMLAVVMEELANCGEGGGEINGFPLMKLHVELLDVEMREEGAEETAFRIAVSDAFRLALQEGDPTLLEPIMRLSLTTPEEYMGDLVNDLQQRRGIVAKTESKGAFTAIEAHAPLENLFGYSGAMRSLSQGRAGCSMEPLRYDAAPPEVVKKYAI